ncbi:MAG: hypothetical protein JWM88_1938 [Verrucomicrobia bacterium]|nr:hypothetical protein [Verrucomicrobiota bacterium]
MPITPKEDAPLSYPRIKHQTQWAGCPLSEEYLIPPEDKLQVLEQLYPFVKIPSLNDTLMDIHEEKEFVVRDFKVVREQGMNMLVSPYYYRSGGSVIDWVPVDPLEEDDPEEDDDGSFSIFGGTMSAQGVKPDGIDRLKGLIERQHEGPGLRTE